LHTALVEDDRDARDILTMVLTYFGAMATSTADASSALRSLRHVRPDVVLCDIQLPDHDGSWLVRESHKHGVIVPFIAISGHDFDQRRLEEHGVEASLRKPVDHDVLVDAVLAVVRRA
jgi:DNA-binding response OmpR family regulator